VLSLCRGIFLLLWLRRRNILGFWVNPMTLGLNNCLLRGILGFGRGLFPFALLPLSILTLDDNLARALSNFGYWSGTRDSRGLLRSFRGIGKDLPDLWRIEDVFRQPSSIICRDTCSIESLIPCNAAVVPAYFWQFLSMPYFRSLHSKLISSPLFGLGCFLG